jgi:hypothetical protein
MAPPGWNSPDTVRAVHSWSEAIALLFFASLVAFDAVAHLETKRHKLFERIGLACFGIAVLAEILAYPYGERNDELAQNRIREQNAALAELEHKNLDLQAKVLDLQAKYAWRELTTRQKELMKGELGKFSGQHFDISKGLSDPESSQYADEIRAALVSAGWIPRDLGGLVTGVLPQGIEIRVHRNARIVPAASALVKMFLSPEFDVKGLEFTYESAPGPGGHPLELVEPGQLAIHVGRKPR